MGEANEVYKNLQEFNLGDRVHKLEEENKRLSELILVLQADVEKLCASVMKMKQIQDNLATNISELYKTAKAEIERKDRMILELRRELDNYIFRRTKHFHSITGSNDVNLSSSSFEQKHCNKDVPLDADHCNERVNLKHDENLQSSVINNQEKSEKISVNVKCDVNIKSHEKDYHPVLEDIDPYVPDNRRYRVGVKREREEKIDRDLNEQSKKKIKYSEYARKYRNKVSRRSGSREHEKSDNSKYDEWQYSEDRKRNEDKRYSDICSYTEKRYKNDRRFIDVSRCTENNKYDDRRYADDRKHSSRWRTDERRFSGDIKYRDRQRSTESKIKTQRFERKVNDEVVAEVPERQTKSLQEKTKITNKETSKIQESSNNTSHDFEDLSQSDIIQDLVEKQKKTMLMPNSSTKSKSSKSKDSRKDKAKHLTDKDNKIPKLTNFEPKENEKNNKHDEIKAAGTGSVDCLNKSGQKENIKLSEIVTKKIDERIETLKTVSNSKLLLEDQSSIESKHLQENNDTTHNMLQKVTERFESSQTLTVTSEIKHGKQNEVKTTKNTVAYANNNSEVVNESPIEKSVGNKNLETNTSHESVNSSLMETKRKRRCVITIQ